MLTMCRYCSMSFICINSLNPLKIGIIISQILFYYFYLFILIGG